MKKFIIPALALAPVVASAQQLRGVESLMRSIQRLVEIALPLVVALALLGFFWGLAKFIFNNGNEDKKEDGKRTMIWGVVALFVMVSVWGLVGFIGDSLGIGAGGEAPVPTVEGL